MNHFAACPDIGLGRPPMAASRRADRSNLILATSSASTRDRSAISFAEFIVLMAALMACNALGVDSMLPALPDIARAFGITVENQRQWIVSAYMLGFGATQLIFGPLSDRFGRRTVTLWGLALYIAAAIFASLATSFAGIIAARAIQGIGAASTRVLAVAIIRDCYSGRKMAQVMSLSFIVFMAVPMLAPSLGHLILLVAPWPVIFHMLAAFAAAVAIWIALRMGETLHPEYRRPLEVKELLIAARTVLTNRCSLGYSVALTMTFGAMLGFISSAQQLFFETFREPDFFPLLFAFVAGGMALAQLLNSQIVLRLGSRLVAHSAMLAYVALCAIHLISLYWLGDNLVSFALFQFAIMFFSGLASSNFGAMAMDPMGEIAGTASSIQGTISALGGATIGILIGQTFDGSALPVVAGFFICSLGMLAAVLYAEDGKLFRPHHAPPAVQ
jgi:DHA1 family bicyclomycin/chloramphenicol resistance-like MFS transporter